MPTTDTSRPVLTTTESRQASPKTMNFRVLMTSLAIAAAIGTALVFAFWTESDRTLSEPPSAAQPSTAAPVPAPPPATPTP